MCVVCFCVLIYLLLFQMNFDPIVHHHVPHRHAPPTPDGVSASNILKTMPCCLCQPPCGGGGGKYHFSTTQPGSCGTFRKEVCGEPESALCLL